VHLRGSSFRQRIGIKLQLLNWMIVSCYTRSMSVHEMTGNTPPDRPPLFVRWRGLGDRGLMGLRFSSDGAYGKIALTFHVTKPNADKLGACTLPPSALAAPRVRSHLHPRLAHE
jgi:hypothetical protein